MTKPPSPRPLSIEVISRIYLYTSPFWILGGIWFGRTMPPILVALGGTQANRASVVMTACSYAIVVLGFAGPILAIGLRRLNEFARRSAILCQGLWMVVYVLLLCFWPRVLRTQSLVAEDPLLPAAVESAIDIVLLASPLLPSVVIIYFLIKRKGAFQEHATMAPTRRRVP